MRHMLFDLARRRLSVMRCGGSGVLSLVEGKIAEIRRSGVTNLLQYGGMPRVVHHDRPDFVVLTSLHYARSYRQRDANVAVWDTVRRGGLPYRLARRFRAEYLNWRFYRTLDPMYEGYFVSPTIEVYRRVD